MSRSTNTQFPVATHVLLLLVVAQDRSVSSDEMAESVLVTPVHLRRVCGRLREAGIVRSRPGPNGGWQLVRAPNEVTLGDVWRAVHRDDPVLAMPGRAEACPVGAGVGALFVDLQARVATAIETELDQTTLLDAVLAGVRIEMGARPPRNS